MSLKQLSFSHSLMQSLKYFVRIQFLVFHCLYFLFFIVMQGGDTLWHLQTFLQYIKYTWIYPLHHSPLFSPSSHSWNSFNRYHFSIYMLVYTVFTPYSPSHTLSPLPLLSRCYHPLQAGSILPSCSPIL
jgi:hypothetical protein